MKYSWLIACREYADNTRTKGFWLGLTLVPLLLWGMIQVPSWLEERAKPVRYFALVDRSGQFEAVVDVALERAHQRKVDQALKEYAARYAKEDSWAKINLEKIPAPTRRADDWLDALADHAPQNEPGGAKPSASALLAQMKPYLQEDAPEFEEPRRDFERVPLPDGLKEISELEGLAQELKPYLSREKTFTHQGQEIRLYAAVLIPADIEGKILRSAPPEGLSQPKGIEYWSANLADTSLRDRVERSVNNEIRRRELTGLGFDTAAISRAMRTYVPMNDLNPKKEQGKEAVSLADRVRQWAPSGFVYLLWLSIFSIVQMLLNNTIEERSNRLIEVLLSSVTPGELMMGKLAGICAIGLTLVGSWIGALILVLLLHAGPEAGLAAQLLSVLKGSNLLPAFLVYFLLGFLMYAGIILAIGSVCNTLKDAQNYMGAIVMVMIVPLMTMMFIPRDPNGTLATVLSWVPIYTPFVMLNRMAADPPLFDMIGTMILLLATTALILWGAGKIFRLGILRSGQPPRLRELLRWLRQA